VTQETVQMPMIVEEYQSPHPPFDAVTAVRDLLQSLPHSSLRGLARIVLTNRRARPIPTLGLYHPDTPAWIEIFVDNIWYHPNIFDELLQWFLGPSAAMATVVFHEIGHHQQYLKSKQFTESGARRWARSQHWRFILRKSPLFFPFLVPVLLCSWCVTSQLRN
jgi:hypothetical protein